MDHNRSASMATNGGAGVDAAGVAPFVAKTYRMVDDPSTDGVIAWGRDNNSFVVADPFAFSQTLLPAHFKHSNFSSFVRQLNTYGFRKVDPDRWEFAHVSFLRGQTHLLSQIVRRSSSNNNGGGKRGGNKQDDGGGGCSAGVVVDEDAVAMEVVRLRREQRAIEEQVGAMWRRVQETERRPKQMLAFLIKVAGDPQVLRRLVGSGGSSGAGAGSGGAGFGAAAEAEVNGANIKRARLLLDAGVGGGSGGSSSGSDGAVDFSGGLYSAGGGEDDAGFGVSDYLQPPPYVFPVNSGY